MDVNVRAEFSNAFAHRDEMQMPTFIECVECELLLSSASGYNTYVRTHDHSSSLVQFRVGQTNALTQLLLLATCIMSLQQVMIHRRY